MQVHRASNSGQALGAVAQTEARPAKKTQRIARLDPFTTPSLLRRMRPCREMPWK